MTDQQPEQRTEEAYDAERQRREREKKEIEKTKSKDAPKTKPPGETSKPERLEIPIVRLNENAEIEAEGIKIDKEIPDIKEEEPKVSIPIVELEKPSIKLKEFALDKVLPEIEAEERKLEVPLIKQDKPREVRCAITAFDNRPPQILPIIRRIPRVPIYRISPQSTVREFVPSFDSRVDSQILQRIDSKNVEDERKEEPLIERQEKVGVSAGGDTGGEPSDSGEEVEEIPDVLHLMFSITDGKIDSGNATIIFLKDTGEGHIGILETICKRVYREKKGGRPNSIIMKDKEEFKKEIRWVTAKDKIFTIELNEKEWDELVNNEKEEWNRITNRLDQLFAQGCGFIIFNKQVAYAPQRHRMNIVEIEPKKELNPDLKRKISSLIWGFVDVNEGGNFDIIFSSAMDKFKKSLENIQYEKAGLYVDITNPHEGEESEEHLQMKWFLVRYLTEKLIVGRELPKNPELQQIKKRIETEKKLTNATADVKSGSEIYEVETLFFEDRAGKIPRNKIKHTIEKYEGEEEVGEINIVLDNLTFLRHLKALRDIKRNYKGWEKEHDKKIGFYTLDLQNNKLIPLREMIERMKRLAI